MLTANPKRRTEMEEKIMELLYEKPEARYLILSTASYEELLKECASRSLPGISELRAMNKYRNLAVSVIPNTTLVDIVELAV